MFADILLSTETVVVVGAMLSALCVALGKIHMQLIASKDEQIKSIRSERASYKEIANEAVANLEAVAHLEAVPPLVAALAAVVPEHSSPPTKKQQQDADLQTMRARLVAATLALGLPPRTAQPPE